MALAILAGAVIAAAGPQVVNNSDWISRPTSAEILSVWPPKAFTNRVNGRAELICEIDVHGLAEACKVASETPANEGFGKAALLLRPSFRLKSAMGPSGPVPTTVSIPIEFKAEQEAVDFRIRNGAPEMREVTMLDHPVWAQAASFADLARAYPSRGGGVEGYAVAHCHVESSGALSGCEARKEDPSDHGFGAAAVELSHRFRVQIDPGAIPAGPPLWVDVPVRFPPPSGVREQMVTSPTWLAGFDPGRAMKLFPPEAIAKGLTTGRGVARCVVGLDGALSHCAPDVGDPDGVGFSEAAVKLASSMKMNPWTLAGGPVDGTVIRLPIRFNLAKKK